MLPPNKALPEGATDLWRVEALQSCLQSAKGCLDNLFTIRPKSYWYLPFPIIMSFTHCVSTLYRLSVVEDPAWDRAAARSQADVLQYLTQFAERADKSDPRSFNEGKGSNEARGGNSAESLWRTIAMWRPTLENAMDANGAEGMNAATEVPTDTSMMEFLDDAFFTDIFGTWQT